MIAAALTCSLTLTSCSNDDSPVGGNPQEETPVQPSQQKRVSQDSEGRIVKGSIYSYSEGSPRPEAPQAISTYEYDGQGRMISHTFAYEKKDYDWQDGDMLTVTNYEWQNDNIHTVTVLNEEGAVKSVRT